MPSRTFALCPLGTRVFLMSEVLSAAGAVEQLPDTLEQTRLLTEVDNLLACRQADGSYAPDDDEAALTNLRTYVAEMALPGAVTSTVQRAEYLTDEGREYRLFTWLGRSAIQVAESGYLYHESAAAHERIEIEIDEAWYSERHCKPGTVQSFISPRMTDADAPREVAEAEHLY